MDARMQQFDVAAVPLSHRITALGFAVMVGGLYFALTTRDADVGFYSDDAVYLLMAQWYSPWWSTTERVFAYVAQQSRFPPVYPLVLGWLGAGVDQPVLASKITVTFLVVTTALFLWWLYRETGRIWIAATVAGVFALLPPTILMAQDLWSEFPFMTFVFLACLAIPADRNDGTGWLAAGLVVALASLTRTAGLALVVAYVIVLGLRRAPRAWILAAVAVLPALAWNLYRASSGQGIHVDTYTALLSGSDLSTGLNQLAPFLEEHVRALAEGWRWLVAYRVPDGFPTWAGPAVSFVIAGAALWGLALRIGRKRLDGIYVAVYLMMITVWPFSGAYFTSRFLYAVMPFLVYFAGVGLTSILRRGDRAVLGWVLLSALLVAVNMSTTTHLVGRAFVATAPDIAPFTRNRKWLRSSDLGTAEAEAVLRRDLIFSLRQVAEQVPEEQCVYAVATPLVMLYSHRGALLPPGPTRSDSDFVVGTRKCRYFVTLAIAPGRGEYVPFYPVARLKQEKGIVYRPMAVPDHADAEPLVILAERVNRP
jgi:hypothetical protein